LTDMQILYFAWVRQKIGKGAETIEPPDSVDTVLELIDWLKTRGEEYAFAFEDLSAIRAAVDQTHQPLEASIINASEVAFFPPVTGG
jgi:molybdopterin synthase sulfur carrier subunit